MLRSIIVILFMIFNVSLAEVDQTNRIKELAKASSELHKFEEKS